MWPLNYSASCLLLVLDGNNNNSDDTSAAAADEAVSLCMRALDATCLMVDFAPAASPSVLLTAGGAPPPPPPPSQRAPDANTTSQSSGGGFERPSAAIYASVISNDSSNNNGTTTQQQQQKSSRCVCLYSPFENSSCRNGTRIRELVRERILKLLASSASSSSLSQKKRQTDCASSSSSAPLPSTLEALVQCTGMLCQLQPPRAAAAAGSGGGGEGGGGQTATTRAQQQQQLPSLIRIMCSGGISLELPSYDKDNNPPSSTTSISSWKDSICALLSAWKNLNTKVTVEGFQHQHQATLTIKDDDDAAAATTTTTTTRYCAHFAAPCPVLSYLMRVGGCSGMENNGCTLDSQQQLMRRRKRSGKKDQHQQQGENDDDDDDGDAGPTPFELVFVCPKCRAMHVPRVASSSSSSSSGEEYHNNSSGTQKQRRKDKLLQIIALQEPPRCPQGCRSTWS